MMKFEIEMKCTLVAVQDQEGIDRETGEVFHWTEVDLLRKDGLGVIQTTVGKRAMNGTTLEKGKDYLFTFVPKPMSGKNGAFIAPKPKVVAVAAL